MRPGTKRAVAVAVLAIAAAATGAILLAGGGEDAPGIADRFQLPSQPRALAVADGAVFVADVDGRLFRIPVGGGEVTQLRARTAADPSEMASGFDSLWLGSYRTGRVTRLSTDDGRRLGLPVPVGESVTGVSVGRRLVWASAGADGIAGGIRPLPAAAYAGSSLVALSSQFPKGAVLSDVAADGNTVWVTDGALDRIYRLDGNAVFPSDAIAVGDPVAVAAGFDAVWVANADDGTISRIDPRAGTPRARSVTVGGEPADIAVGEQGVWVADRRLGRVVRIDPETSRVEGRLKIGLDPEALAIGEGSVWAIRAGIARDELIRIEP